MWPNPVHHWKGRRPESLQMMNPIPPSIDGKMNIGLVPLRRFSLHSAQFLLLLLWAFTLFHAFSLPLRQAKTSKGQRGLSASGWQNTVVFKREPKILTTLSFSKGSCIEPKKRQTNQRIFQVLVRDGRSYVIHVITQFAVYTPYIPVVYIAFNQDLTNSPAPIKNNTAHQSIRISPISSTCRPCEDLCSWI